MPSDSLSVCPQSVHRLTPNIFREGFSAEAIDGSIVRLMEQNGLDPEAETPGCLDAVEVGWWSSDHGSPIAVLKRLAKMCEDESETDAETGEVTLTAAKKIKALGVYDFPATYVSPSLLLLAGASQLYGPYLSASQWRSCH